MLFTAQVVRMVGGPSIIAFALDAAGGSAGPLTVRSILLIGLLLSLTPRSR